MRINRLKLVDFRNHAETDITFERLTCVRGANRTGKSSIRQGLEFALTGRTDGTDARGAGAAGLIRQGADKATILLKLQANKEIDLKCTLTEASGRTVTVTDASDPAWNGAAVKQFLDDQRDVLSCLLNSQYFIKLKPAEQKSLLSSIILPDQYDCRQRPPLHQLGLPALRRYRSRVQSGLRQAPRPRTRPQEPAHPRRYPDAGGREEQRGHAGLAGEGPHPRP